MKKLTSYLLSFFCISVFFVLNTHAQAEWKKKEASIMTPWSENIDPDNLFNEYPRPQMIRDNWTNLNGIWDFAKKSSPNIGSYNDFPNFNSKILVPFPIESALSGIMDTDYDNKNKSYAYRREFTVPQTEKGKRILLHFGAVDWQSVVFINGSKVGEHKGGFDSFSFDITNYLKPLNEPQELVVQIYDPTKGGQPRGKQDTHPGGIWYTPSSGIWQTVWYESVNEKYIRDFSIIPDVDNKAVKIKIDVENALANTKVDVVILDKNNEVTKTQIPIGVETAIKISNPKLWSPESPFLYDLKFVLKDGEDVVDQVSSYFGMRKITLGKLRGKPYMFLNDNPVFHYGTLDQGFWPDGLFTSPSYEALRWDLEKTKELGFNMVRKHIKVEPARWYYYCDSIGLMVWQDMVTPVDNSGSLLGDASWVKGNFYRESENTINMLKNYPSIVVWVPYNEGWGQFDGNNNSEHTRKGVELVRRLDKSRLINQSSGWTNFELGDIIDKHSYTTPSVYENPFNHRANVCGETGGYSLVIEGHIWSHNSSIYNTLKSSEELIEKLEELNQIAFDLTADGFAGLVYTQITDVEEENNGFFTYDRKKSKMNEAQIARFKAGIEKIKTKALKVKYVIPTALQSEQNIWKYTTGGIGYSVSSGWNSDMNFNDKSWKEGAAGFGNNNPPNSKIRTQWDNQTIYLRKKIELPNDLSTKEKSDLKLSIYYDEDFELYINGVLAASAKGYSTGYQLFDISSAAKKTLKYGKENLFAIKCIQTTGGQYIDMGLVIGREIDLEEDIIIPEKPKTFIEISNAAEFDAIRNNLSGFYKLTADIDLSGYPNFTPIGSASEPFEGCLEGGKHAIKNLEINRQGDFQAIFASANGAYFNELEIENPKVKGNRNVASLVGKCVNTTIRRVVVTNPVINGLEKVGGIAGETENGEASYIRESYIVNGDISARTSIAGGLLGAAHNTRIEHSYFTGVVNAPGNGVDNFAGGIIGSTENPAVQLRGVVSLASSVKGGVSAQFAPKKFPLVEQTNIFARRDMNLSANLHEATRAPESQKLSLTEFKKQSLYELMGWDFENVWRMSEDGFPVFKEKFGTSVNPPLSFNIRNLNVYPYDSGLLFESLNPASVWVYNMTGMLAARLNTEREGSVRLPQGIYIVKSVSQGTIETMKVRI